MMTYETQSKAEFELQYKITLTDTHLSLEIKVIDVWHQCLC
jgi:hypothetical protein